MEIEINAGEERPAESFRETVEAAIEDLRAGLLAKLSGTESDEAAGLLRTFEQRILAVETVQAENTSAILRLTDSLYKQTDGALSVLTSRVNELADQVKALQPPGQ